MRGTQVCEASRALTDTRFRKISIFNELAYAAKYGRLSEYPKELAGVVVSVAHMRDATVALEEVGEFLAAQMNKVHSLGGAQAACQGRAARALAGWARAPGAFSNDCNISLRGAPVRGHRSTHETLALERVHPHPASGAPAQRWAPAQPPLWLNYATHHATTPAPRAPRLRTSPASCASAMWTPSSP